MHIAHREILWFYGFTAHGSFTPVVAVRWSAVCFGFGYGYVRNWTSATAPLSATTETRKNGFGRSLQSTEK